MQISQIETLTRKYADARDVLSGSVSILNHEIDELYRRHMPGIKKAQAKCADAYSELQSGISQAPELFVKPRTVTFHGIKVGFQKGKGGVLIADPDKTVELIRKHLPDRFDDLVQTTHKPLAAALNNLEAMFVKKIGCEIANSVDEVVIRPVDSDVEKIVNRLMKLATEEDAS